jgi:two-component system cell cycle response regulator CtrA
MRPSEYERALSAKDEQLAELIEENAWLRSLVKADAHDIFPRAWRMTPTESKILYLLYTRPSLSFEAAMACLYSDKPSEPETKIITVYACRLRRILRPYGVAIRSRHSYGYFIPDEGKAAIRAYVEPKAKAA